MLPFLVTPCLVVAVQPCMERIPNKKKNKKKHTNLIENLECQDDNVLISNNVEVMNTNDLQLLQKINDTIRHVKECSSTLLPFLVQIEGVTATPRRKLLKGAPHIDSIIKETMSEIAWSSKVSQEDDEEHHEENCFDMFDWLIFTMFLS